MQSIDYIKVKCYNNSERRDGALLRPIVLYWIVLDIGLG